MDNYEETLAAFIMHVQAKIEEHTAAHFPSLRADVLEVQPGRVSLR